VMWLEDHIHDLQSLLPHLTLVEHSTDGGQALVMTAAANREPMPIVEMTSPAGPALLLTHRTPDGTSAMPNRGGRGHRGRADKHHQRPPPPACWGELLRSLVTWHDDEKSHRPRRAVAPAGCIMTSLGSHGHEELSKVTHVI
jgi:hypothetical protein